MNWQYEPMERWFMMNCPCGSGLSFDSCCHLLHSGQVAQTAEQLMRSRYSAFALNDIDYLVKTTVQAQQPLLDRAAIDNWSQQNHWLGLQLLTSTAKIGKRHAQVEFVVRFRSKQIIGDQQLFTIDYHSQNQHAEQMHHECSTFVRHQQSWYFLDPTVKISSTLNQPCLCLSGQKFKRCCGPFLDL